MVVLKHQSVEHCEVEVEEQVLTWENDNSVLLLSWQALLDDWLLNFLL